MLTFMQKSFLEDELLNFASRIARMINTMHDKQNAALTFFLHGPLGAGKTTFARGFLRGLGFHGKVKSPTYTLVEPYEIGQKFIFHFDFYRISNPKELDHLGLQDYFSKEAITLIEWPENGFPHLPKPDLDLSLSFANPGRKIILKAESEQGEVLLNSIHVD